MPQSRIPLEPGLMYHVWTHANGGENLFRTDENYDYFLEKYTHHVHPVAETFAYCLMPNHLHLMIRVKKESVLSTLPGFGTLEGLETSKAISRKFSNLFNGYAQAYNKMYDRKGSLFMDSFNRKLIDSKEYFTRLIIYIHNNPVHHGFVVKPDDWPYSSWHAYLFEKRTKISKTEGLAWFGGRESFVEVHRNLTFDSTSPNFED